MNDPYNPVYTITLYDQYQCIVKEEVLNHLYEPQHAVQEAQSMLADHMEDNHAGLVKVTGPGVCKVIYQEPGEDTPVESDFDERVITVGLDE